MHLQRVIVQINTHTRHTHAYVYVSLGWFIYTSVWKSMNPYFIDLNAIGVYMYISESMGTC